MMHLSSHSSIGVKAGIIGGYLFLFILYFSPISVPYKGVFPLAFLTVFAFWFSSPMMVAALFFSALGDYMGILHHFWGQMLAFAVAHVAYICFFMRQLQKEKRVNVLSVSSRWKAMFLFALGLLIYFLIPVNVNPLSLRVGVTVYSILILTMCWSAWIQSNGWYTFGAWLFVFSDFMLAWNKFNTPIEYIRYWIMVPYLLGQCLLFLPSIGSREK